MDPAEAAIQESIRQARAIYARGHGDVLAILKSADQDLAKRLGKHAGSDRFTAASAQLYRKQIGIVTTYLEQRLAGHTHEQANKAVAASVKQTVKVAKKLENSFTGITRPLALESQHRLDQIVHGQSSSLLRRHQSSFNRYGRLVVADFERTMRQGLLQGLTQEQMVSRLVEAGRAGGHSAESLHQNEPQHFPQPTSYVKRRYWAERIVRTEVAHAYNGAALATMYETRATEFPDLQKKILATFDMRTAADSVAVHGQVRPLDGYFTDGAGRTYQYPPARPNDREVVVPWRPHWTETPSSEPPPPEEVAEAKVAAEPSPLGEERKQSLGAAVQAAKAKLLAKKAADAELKAQILKAQAAQGEGAQALEHAVVADQKALQKAVAQGKAPVSSSAAYEAAKAKAQAYKEAQAEIAKAKAAAERAAQLAKFKQEAAAVSEAWSKPGTHDTGKALLADLKHLSKTSPRMFAEVYHLNTGKPASAALKVLEKPAQLGKLVKELGKKLQPDLEFPEPKPKKPPPLTAEQLLAQKKAALLAPNVSFAEVGATITAEDIHALTKGNPLVLPGEHEEVANLSHQGKAAYLQQVISDWDKAQAKAAAYSVQEEKVSAKHFQNVFDPSGKKVAFFYQQADGSYLVSPPPALPTFSPFATTSFEAAKAYSIQVGEEFLAYKQAQAAEKAAAYQQEAAEAAKKTAAAKAAEASKPRPPTAMLWSSKYQPTERPEVELKQSPAKDVAQNLKKDRAGHQLALDEDWIENFEVHFSQEIHQGETVNVVRFKVTGHRAEEVFENLKGKQTAVSYQGIKDLKSDVLEKSADRNKPVPAATAYQRQVGTAQVTLYRASDIKGGYMAATHNLVEMRFPGSAEEAFEQAKQGFKRLGISPSRPSEETQQAYKRAAILAKLDPDSALEMKNLKDRSAGSIAKVWEKAIVRNPKLAQIEADATLREVAPGKHALYSEKLAQLYQDAGVTHLEHSMNPTQDGLETVRQILLQGPEGERGGLLSSRTRYERGLFFQGQSTGRDFETGGADSVFTRVRTTAGAPGYSQWTFEIDPKELGRIDAYAFNGDNYGAAGPKPELASGGHARKTAEEVMALARTASLAGDNELMLQGQIPATSIRRVVTRDNALRKETLDLFRKAGVTTYNGIPIEEFVVTKQR